jgi:predicted lactoylglutathione lyase
MEFFKQLGYSFNMQFTDETAACLVISDTIYAMLLTEEKYKSFLPQGKQMADATKTSQVIVALSAESKDKVDELVNAAFKAGATEARPDDDYGFMFLRSFTDPDGHIWEVFWMNPEFLQQQSQQ